MLIVHMMNENKTLMKLIVRGKTEKAFWKNADKNCHDLEITIGDLNYCIKRFIKEDKQSKNEIKVLHEDVFLELEPISKAL